MRPSELDPGRWRTIDAILEAALDTPSEDLPAFLKRACAGDEGLEAEVKALLTAEARSEVRFDPPGAAWVMESLTSWARTRVEGRTLGPFRLSREIGRGGMGVVYLAEDTRLGRQVALKVLPPWLGAGREARRRFEAEARAASVLDHPNIATLHEIDETGDGELYMVFAYYEGETLEARLLRGSIPPADAVRIASETASGLGAAHAAGVIHRDVKPSNVLLTEGGAVKLLDFGVAKMAGENLTVEGVRVGTTAYMSPEHVRGDPIDARSDLWSLGVVLYEMLTGVHPFTGTDPPSMMRSILEDDPKALATAGTTLEETLQRILDKLLCKRSEGRYRDTEEVLTDLRAARSGHAPPVAARDPPPPPRPRIRRIAVLPVADLTDDAAHAHLLHGVHDALIAELGKIRAMGVVSRTSMARFRKTELSIPEIAEMLEVDAVVEGSVSRAGDGLAITVSLIAASPERHIWSDTFRSGWEHVQDIAAEVAGSIAAELGVRMSPSEERRLGAAPSAEPAAYEAYTMGLRYLERRSPRSHELAQKHLRRAIELDSRFAPAYAMLAEACGSAAFFGLVSPADSLPLVRSLVERALALDSNLASAHTVLGAVRHFGDWDWTGAEAALRRAIALNPSYAYAHFMLGEVLSAQRRFQEALAAAEVHRTLEPFVPFSAFGPVYILIRMGDFDGAIERAAPAVEFFADFWQGPWLLGQSLVGKEMYGQAIMHYQAAADLSARTPMALGPLGQAFALTGRREDALQVLGELEQMARTTYVGPTNFAMIHAGLGDQDRAFDWLERAYEERDMALVHLGDVLYRPLWADSRFAELLRRMGLESPVPSGPGEH